jgi:hypothetical protein
MAGIENEDSHMFLGGLERWDIGTRRAHLDSLCTLCISTSRYPNAHILPSRTPPASFAPEVMMGRSRQCRRPMMNLGNAESSDENAETSDLLRSEGVDLSKLSPLSPL